MINKDLEEVIIYNTLGKLDLLEDRVDIIENYNLNDIDSPTGNYNFNNKSIYGLDSISGTNLIIESDQLFINNDYFFMGENPSFEADIEFSKIYSFAGGGHSDYLRIVDKNNLLNTINSSLKPMTIGFVTENSNTMGLTFKAERVINGGNVHNVSIGIMTSIGNDEDVHGGSLYFSNKSGLGGIAINHKIADARLHVNSEETIKAIFSGSNTGGSGIQIVNQSTSGSSFVGFGNSSTLSNISAYIEKISVNNGTYLGEMVLSNNDSGFSFYVQAEADVFKIRSNKNANYKYNFGIGLNSNLTLSNEARLTVRQTNNGNANFGYGWIAGAFGGGANSSGNMVVMGSASSNAILAGATIDALDWADLYINPSSKTSFGLSETSTLSAIVNIGASTTAKASLNIAVGTAPTTPNEGDIWRDNTDSLKVRIGGVTKTINLV